MKLTKSLLLTVGVLAAGSVVTCAHGAVTLTTLVSFGGTNGANPYAGTLRGKDGNFYGTTAAGGTNGGYGTIFQMTPAGALTVLASFDRTNGANPTAGLAQGVDGEFYGTTYSGGAMGYGTVFNMTTNGTLTSLVSFVGTNGMYPKARLVEANDGNYYGTTALGGTNGFGTVFKMTTNGTLATLVSFDLQDASSYAGLVQGMDGSLYGTTYGSGTVFKMTTNGTFLTLYSFTGGGDGDGSNPYAELVQGADGNLYGTTFFGGTNGFGTVYKLTTNGAFTKLVSFGNTNGAYPQGRLVQTSDGILYGTTESGGAYTNLSGSGYGTAFKLTTNGTLTTLVSFGGTNGANPQGGLVQGADGNLYGTTVDGGASGEGTIFRLNITAPPPPSFLTAGETGATLTLTWSATVGETYQMWYKTNLNQINWNNLGSTIIATNAAMTTLDATGPDPQRFYRIELLP
jgi:uncharacterized repeat protein (TIGR03803 family)